MNSGQQITKPKRGDRIAVHYVDISKEELKEWNRAVECGVNGFVDIYLAPGMYWKFVEMALLAMTAPTQNSYCFSVSGTTENHFEHEKRAQIMHPACITELYDGGPNRERLNDGLRANYYLAYVFSNTILKQLTTVSMVNADDKICIAYKRAIEDLLSILLSKNAYYKEVAAELFSFHPINFAEQYFREAKNREMHVNLDQYASLIQREDMPKKWVIAAVEQLIKVVKVLEAEGESLEETTGIKAGWLSEALCRSIADDNYGFFKHNLVSKGAASEVFKLVYEFLRDSTIPFHERDIRVIASKIRNREERYSFCVRTMRGHEGLNDGLRYSSDKKLINWLFKMAQNKEDKETIEFLALVKKNLEARRKSDQQSARLKKTAQRKKESEKKKALMALFNRGDRPPDPLANSKKIAEEDLYKIQSKKDITGATKKGAQ